MKALPRRRRAVLTNSVLGAVLVAGAGGAYAAVDSGGAAPASAGTRTATVTRGTVLATVSGSGSLTSPTDAGVSFSTGGQLTEVDVAAGQKVVKGQTLAKVDATAANETLSQAEASLAAAEANLTKARQGQTTTSTSSGGSSGGSSTGSSSAGSSSAGSAAKPAATAAATGAAKAGAGGGPGGSGKGASASSPSGNASAQGAEYVPGQGGGFAPAVAYAAAGSVVEQVATVDPAALAQAEAQLTQAQNAVTAAQRAVAGTVLTAPVDGTVASVAGRVGQTVAGAGGASGSGNGGSGAGSNSASGSSGLPTGFVVITNPTGMQVSANFSEGDALKIQSGQAATVTLNAQPGTTLNATVVAVSSLPVSGGTSSANGSGSAVQYAATLNISNPPANLRTGLSASIQVVVGEASDALCVPAAAVSGTGANRTATVVNADGSTQRVAVTVGVEGDTFDQITSGLTEGQKVRIVTVASTGTGGFPSGVFPGAGGLGGGRGVGGGGGGFGGGRAAGGAGGGAGGRG